MYELSTANRRRSVATIAIILALMATLVGVGTAGAITAAEREAGAEAALDWLAKELDANGGTMPGFGQGTTDWGLTADAVLALSAGGRGMSREATVAVDLLVANSAEFTTWAPTMPEVRVAGATAKTLLVLGELQRPSVIGGVDLEAELRSMMATSGPFTGRFRDRVPNESWDASNGFGQSLSVIALSLTAQGAPDQAIDFLLAQQCPSGGFPLSYTAATCTDNSSVDTDATALTTQALMVVERSPRVLDALQRAVSYLEGRQDPTTGAFGGTGPTAGINSNSTGLAAQVLRTAGRNASAERAAEWIITSTQISHANAPGTPASLEIGAIAYEPSALRVALADGITTSAGDQWRRATSQAVLGLGLPGYGPKSVAPLPVDPTDPGSTSTSSTSTTSVNSTSTSTTTVTSTPTTTSAPGPENPGDPSKGPNNEQPPTFDRPGGGRDTDSLPHGAGERSGGVSQGVTSGTETLDSSRSRSGAVPGQRSRTERLARTGSDPLGLALAAIALVGTGAVLISTRRRRFDVVSSAAPNEP